MNLDVVILRIKALCPIFGGRAASVEGRTSTATALQELGPMVQLKIAGSPDPEKEAKKYREANAANRRKIRQRKKEGGKDVLSAPSAGPPEGGNDVVPAPPAAPPEGGKYVLSTPLAACRPCLSGALG